MSFKTLWQGRVDAEDGATGQRWHQVVKFERSCVSKETTTLIGYPNDLGVAANKGRVGASGGPNAIRQFLANLPWHQNSELLDAGDAPISDELATTQSAFAAKVVEALENGQSVLGLGGGHDIAWGSFQGLAQHSAKRIGIINFDAHLDLRKPAPATSSGTPFRQVAEYCQHNGLQFHYACLGVSKAANTQALFDYAEKTHTSMLFDIDFTLSNAQQAILPMLREVDQLYVTVCMDAFPVSLCPGVSAPSALGICPNETIKVIQWLSNACTEHDVEWRLSDIAELNPSLDSDNKTARFAARIAFELTSAMSRF
ncbi:formimidoylglutamase [Alteromonas ponticola]|uniref:Formimidoylglutamase n=1 Tax=Alteromonas aquimaris TaxID=2998417 RepID=A0ABT3P701_9ALTE|nr:formimidoylglutamase [Alteromonas aquimaris]MCW8108550.1 formimidoylglutamase [Alteromonas aquimaris]